MYNESMGNEEKIREFFVKYAERFNNALQDPPVVDVDGVVNSFASFFLEASPVGVLGGPNDTAFRERIAQGFSFYKNIGTTSMRIATLNIEPLDEYHSTAKVHWDSHYKKKDGSDEHIEFDVIYFIQTLIGQPKIFAYVTGDEQKVLKERGLVQ